MILDAPTASQFARVVLAHLTREYPNKLDHVLASADDARAPRALHPIFYGSFDWHSCVHGYWSLMRLYARFPELPEAARIRDVVDAHFTADNVAAEVAYLARPSSRGFERPYGWAWLLELAAELEAHPTAEAKRWSALLAPLARAFRERLFEHLPNATYPVRAGTHASSAFALALALDYAEAASDVELGRLIRDKAALWYGGDRDCQAWEPGGEDFLSPTLVEAECMRRALGPGDFDAWLRAFLPGLEARMPSALFHPATVSDRSDGKIVHLDGLNLSRAWCLSSLARSMREGDARRDVLRAAAHDHLAASLPHVTGDYMGEHWLVTYAILALDA